MTLRELINQNFGISGKIAIKDIDTLDESEIVCFNSIKDTKVKQYLDWDIIQIYPAYSETSSNSKIVKFLNKFKGKKNTSEEKDVVRSAVLVIAVCHHYISESDEYSDDEPETPKNFK